MTSVADYLIESSKMLTKSTVNTLLLGWEHQKVRQVLAGASLAEIMNVAERVRTFYIDHPRIGGPAIAVVLSAAASHAHNLPLGASNLFIDIVESYLVSGADYATQFHGCELLLSAFRSVLRGYTALLVAHPSKTLAGLETLAAATHAFSPGAHHLTPAHSLFLQVVLSSRTCIEKAVDFLDRTIITEIDPSATGSTLADYLCYYYYAGILYASVKRWKESIWSLESALTVRSYGCNAIMMAAYKAFVLISLIADGAVRPLLNTHAEKYTRLVCKEYVEVQEAFEKRNFVEMNLLMEKYAKVFKEDQLDPLAGECHAALLRHSILALTNVYVSCTVSGIAEEMGTTAEVVHRVLQEMILSGEVCAQISEAPPYTVTFRDAQTASSTVLREAIVKCEKATEAVSESHHDVLASMQFVSHQLRNDPKFSEIMVEHQERRREENSTFRKFASMLHH